MIVIGLTGSVGTGKTSTCMHFSNKNIPVFDCDKEVKALLNNKKIQSEVKTKFPDSFHQGKLNKKKLAEKVFADKKKVHVLESILYKNLYKKQSLWIRSQIMRREKIVVFDVPLLFEKDSLKKYDLIILVTCSFRLQRIRVLKRKDWDEKRFTNVFNLQLNDNVKRQLSDIVINTDRSKRYTYNKVNEVLRMCNYLKGRSHKDLLRKFQ